MKKHLIYIIGIAATLCTACENVSEDERVLEVSEVQARRTVLLEDYTGQACKNCPEAHKEAASLYKSKAFHDNLIIVAIHAGMQAIPSPVGLKQPEGDEYANKYGVETYPVGMVNRRGGLKEYPSWGEAVYGEVQRKSPLEISAEASYSDRKVSVRVDLQALETVEGKLQLWVTEDNIVTFQTSGEERIPQYVHNHVFLDAINGTWGEDVVLVSDEQKVIEYRDFELAAAWNRNPENLSVVAFVYNNDGVLQAAQCKVTVNE